MKYLIYILYKMSYPESLDNTKSLETLLFKKEYAQLYLPKRKQLEFVNESTLDSVILKENLLTLHSHQLFVKNLINPDTPYTRLLLKHSTGTGKTIAAISITMQFIKYYQLQHNLTESSGYSNTPYIYIIGFSKQIFQKELLKRPEFGFITKEEIAELKKLRYLADVGSQRDKEIYSEYESRIKKRLSKKNKGGFFKFFGYKEFFNRLFIFSKKYAAKVNNDVQLSEDQILNGLKTKDVMINFELLDTFVNSIVICDEIHNVYNSSEINNYGIALKMLMNIFDIPEFMGILNEERIKIYRNSILRVLFMSATPINNSPTEIIDLLNLLIPLNRLPNQKRLDKNDFFEDNRNLKPDALEKISKLVRGYVSYLRDDNPKYFPEKIFEGESLTIPDALLKNRVSFYSGTTIPYIKFVRCPMSEYHQLTYDKIYTGSLPPDGQSLMDIVLPNPGLIGDNTIGLFKTKDIKYNLINATQTWKDTNKISIDKMPNTNIYMITGEFMRYENLKYFSTKYVEMLDAIFDNLLNDKGKIIISHQYVKMSGALFIQEVLRRNGILDDYANPTDDTLCSKCGRIKSSHVDSNHDFMPARFVMYYGDIDKQTLDKTLDKFKNVENTNGYYYRILVGSKIINEGIDFNSIQNIWIMNVPANIPTLLQILGRGIRKNSHLDLPIEKRKVRIKIFVSSNRKKQDLTYEERKYFEKSQDYLVIQQIEKIFNENAIDAVIHRSIIMPQGQNKDDDLGSLYFEPSSVFGKKWDEIINHNAIINNKELSLSTFNAFYANDEISLLLYCIKRLFIEQSPIWTFDDLITSIKNPPFELHVNPALFLDDDIIIALNILTNYQLYDNNVSIDTYQMSKSKDIDKTARKLLDRYDKKILISNIDHVIVFIEGYYCLFPLNYPSSSDVDVDKMISNLGINSSIAANPDIDFDNWYRVHSSSNKSIFRVTKYLKTSNISYNQMKYKFYNQFRSYTVEELPTSVEVYDVDFHSKLIEDSIKYAFSILTNSTLVFSELHEFYFKMLYFYDRLDLILFANHLEDTKLIEHYKKYITDADLKIDVYDKNNHDHDIEVIAQYKYNPFLMSSILKSGSTRTFNINRLNNFLGNRAKQNDDNITKVYSNMLPVGHFLNSSLEGNTMLSVPKIYLPDLESKSYPWFRAYDFVQQQKVPDIENEIIIGYYEKNPTGIDIKFKLRPPNHKIVMHDDSRLIERGSACNTRKKEDLIKIYHDLGMSGIDQDNINIKSICNDIKLELMNREMKERRKVKHDENYKRIRWFYLHYEIQSF